jgi:glucokinase
LGIGLPGLVRRDGRLAFAPNLQTASGADLGALLGNSLSSAVVFCENDANCAALAEHEWGAGRGIDDFVMVTLGTGIGGGIIAGGQLIRGRNGFAGEIGHMVVEARGAACKCGGQGCWERYASGGGLGRMTRVAARAGQMPELVARCGGDPENVRSEDVTAAAAEGVEEAVGMMRVVGWWLALGLANLTAILDCGHFVIGGGLSEASDVVLPTARESLVDLVEGYESRPTITVATSMFGARSGAMGAALVAFERLA